MENECRVVAVIGNPDTGKTTLFHKMTGARGHMGRCCEDDAKVHIGAYQYYGRSFITVDWPSLYTPDKACENTPGIVYCPTAAGFKHGACRNADVTVVVADAARLELGLHLLKQVMKQEHASTRSPVVLCINHWEEARHNGIAIDGELMEDVLQIPVILYDSKRHESLDDLKAAIYYAAKPENAEEYQYNCPDFSPKKLTRECMTAPAGYGVRRIIADSVLTNPVFGKLIWLFLLAGVLKLAMAAAGAPSRFLWSILSRTEEWLSGLAPYPDGSFWLWDCLIHGGFRALSWTVAVMLPPLAVFLFCYTLLEEWGLLPRISCAMDPVFEKCGGCGGQCLTMALGLGCNAAAIARCHTITAPRERLAALLTNSMIPCCGRYPVFMALIPLLFVAGPSGSLSGALLFAALLLFAVYLSMSATWLLSRTFLKTQPSGFTLELPPYRPVHPASVLSRTLAGRTLPLITRAAKAAVPAGIIIWLLANVVYTGNGLFALAQQGGGGAVISGGGAIGSGVISGGVISSGAISSGVSSGGVSSGGVSLLHMFTDMLTPLAALMGMNGIILAAFILSFPANELMLPILLMACAHTSAAAPSAVAAISAIPAVPAVPAIPAAASGLQLLSSQGWTWTTILCTLIFALFHWPCLTTCRAIARETGSWKWAAASAFICTLPGILLCLGITICSQMVAGI